ncbi:hypothetical protein SAMN05444169_0118 [Bradyrhizobium erythrophlei]|uniref:Uncharacterized protein n=1 Tax=Bradyrhizobium erythrophlei TaxID=1437360 RepID=A0A1M5GG75_9BRAD|nr:hypothetical protein SAMN05444169_0118 [Bradyrhizobium erythrophlei]
MSWTRERDLLIAQTMTFVQSITGKKPEARTETRIEFAPVDQIENATRPIEMRSYERSCLRRGRRRRPGPNFARKSRAGWRHSAPTSSFSTASAMPIVTRC